MDARGAVTAGLVAAAIVGTTAVGLVADKTAPGWPMFGQNVANTAANTQVDVSAKNVGQLKPKWTLTTGGDVSARAAVVDGVVYVPDWGGNLWAVNSSNGKPIWHHQLSDYGLTGSFTGAYHSRTTPAVANGIVFVGTQEGAYLLAINATTGGLVWKTQLESTDAFAIISTSPAVSNGVVYTGVASTAEGATLYGAQLGSNTWPRGSAVAVDAATGTIKWKTYTIPAGYYGGGVWGSNPVVDAARNTVFVSTGNNYRHPDDSAESSNPAETYGQCIGNGGTAAICNSPNDHVDSVLALDLETGAVKWATSETTWNQMSVGVANGSDDWNVDCALPSLGINLGAASQCPTSAGPDYDFGSAPNEITYQTADGPKTILGAGQKSGIYYALDPDTGAVLWRTQVAPGSSLGGMEWGSASDGQRIYVQDANLYGIGAPGFNAGSWSALDPATGAILWQTQDPNGAADIGPVTAANGVVYVSSMAGAPTAPTMLALDAATGHILWRFASGVSVNAGASIVQDTVYWGSGYAHLGFPGYTGSATTGKFFAFTKNGF